VDEWGTWFDVEPGTNPGFLYQQNTIRDALVAGINFHIFHDHCDRVEMANIAQVINVLQSVILTEGERLLLTPTYHVFDMYKVHQDATLLSTHLISDFYEHNGRKQPQTSVSASKDDQGRIHISICNLDPTSEADVRIELRGIADESALKVSGTELTASSIDSHNTFDHPNAVKPQAFHAFSLEDKEIRLQLSAKSVTVLEVSI